MSFFFHARKKREKKGKGKIAMAIRIKLKEKTKKRDPSISGGERRKTTLRIFYKFCKKGGKKG